MESGGQPGNTNSTADKRLITNALRRVVTQSPEKLKTACEKILDDAVDGNLAAFGVIADRLEGKPAQSHNLDGHLTYADITEVLLGDLTDDSGDS